VVNVDGTMNERIIGNGCAACRAPEGESVSWSREGFLVEWFMGRAKGQGRCLEREGLT